MGWVRSLLAVGVLAALSAGVSWAGDENTEKPKPGVGGEFCGKVAIEKADGKPAVVRLVPREGAAVVVTRADIEQWQPRADQWVEAEGRLIKKDGGLAMHVKRVKVRKSEPALNKPPADVDGVLRVEKDGTARVETPAGVLTLANDDNGKKVAALGDGKLVEVEGVLSMAGDALSMCVAKWKELKKLDADDEEDDGDDEDDEEDD